MTIFFQHCPQAKLARELALNFRIIFENKDTKALPDWIQQAKSSGIAALKNFAIGLESDYAAVEAAATYHWSNGQIEGQVNRLKLIKKQMYGRVGFDLLRKESGALHQFKLKVSKMKKNHYPQIIHKPGAQQIAQLRVTKKSNRWQKFIRKVQYGKIAA